VVPTVLEYLHLPPAGGLDGRSLLPLVSGERSSRRSLYAGCSLLQNRYAVLDGERKYIANRIPPLGLFRPARWMSSLRAFYKFGPSESYDLLADSAEKRNLMSSDPRLAAQMDLELLRELARRRRSGASFPLDPDTLRRLRTLGYVQ
jgi:hypothetical protein